MNMDSYVFIIMILLATFTFNMTQELLNEQRVLPICLDTEIYLDWCMDKVGSIDKDYGEPKR